MRGRSSTGLARGHRAVPSVHHESEGSGSKTTDFVNDNPLRRHLLSLRAKAFRVSRRSGRYQVVLELFSGRSPFEAAFAQLGIGTIALD